MLDELWNKVQPLGNDERRVLIRIADRLHAGARYYGPFDLQKDQRDLLEEAVQETLDQSVYLAAKLEQLKRAHA